MLGALTGVMIWKSFGQEAYWPTPVRNGGVIVLGAMMGSWFTPETARQIIVQLPGMLLITGTSLLFGFGLAYFTARQTGVSLASSLLGSTPGGLTQMTIICDEFEDADLAVVSVLQTIRMQMVVFIVPFLAIHAVAGSVAAAAPVAVSGAPAMGFNQTTAVYVLAALGGAAAGKRLSVPTPFMLGPLAGVAILGVSGLSLPQTPALLSALSQFCMGTYMGRTIDFASFRSQKKLLLYAVLGGLIMVGSSLLSAWVLTALYPAVELTTAFLCAAPGGTAEMGLTAVMIHADVSMVSAYQIFRLLFIIVMIPYFFRWWLCRSQPAE
jgi:membrane AbrB-like protein